MKRLRKKYGSDIRFFHCGEYGEINRRPHYHAIIFNHDFHDKIHYKTVNEQKLYVSGELQALWSKNEKPIGFCTTGTVTFESAAYVARYCLKKVTGDDALESYWNSHTGKFRTEEYCTMSRRPGIAAEWFKAFRADVYPDDFVIVRGKKMKPPKFYAKKLEDLDEAMHGSLRIRRILEAKKHTEDQTPERLNTRRIVQEAQLAHLPRNLEQGKMR